MTGVMASGSLCDPRQSPVRPMGDERWFRRNGEDRSRIGRANLAIVVGSICIHAVVLALALAGSRAVAVRSASEPIPVEVVQAVPGEKNKTVAQPQPAQPQPAQAQAAPKPSQPAQSKQAQNKPAPLPSPTPEPAHAPRSDERQDLEKQLAELKAEQSALKREQASLAQEPTGTTGGLGPLRNSFQAVALPSDAAGQGEAVGYAELVFSQLAKAKGIGRRIGQPGSAGVRFDVDAAGGLADVELVTSSGIASLDAEALATVRKAAPFPVPPPGAQRSFSANVSFVAEGAPP